MAAKKGIYIFTLIGLLLGFVLDYAYRLQESAWGTSSMANGYSILFSCIYMITFSTIFALLYTLAYNETHRLRLLVTSFIGALILSFCFLGKTGYDLTEHLLIFTWAFPVYVYIGLSFHYAIHHDNTWKITYPTLFAAVWNMFILLCVAGLFASLANLLVLLAALLFSTLGYEYLWNLYSNNIHFSLILNSTLFFIGLGVGQQNINIIYSLRFLLLRMMYYLLPFFALISIVYFILYQIGPAAAAQTLPDYINPLPILIALVFIGILFFNAYYQDGDVEKETAAPLWLKWLLKIYRVILLFLILMMLLQIYRKNAYMDINGIICLLAVFFYGLLYALSACVSAERERTWIQSGNIGIALFFMASLFVLNLPYIPLAFDVGKKPAHTAPIFNFSESQKK
ncbi:MAG: hypothetical protein P4L79_05875 [Legionella sp.]|uniref:hypothetical protein n=1 Tax=Legionella sp. TaxID=459 RepID=UPI00284672F9|nr:hypothetical protein [Legionella sp.]